MKTHEIAQRWIDFFVKKNHVAVPSTSLVSPDPSVLFVIAGMIPFVPYFTGAQPAPFERAVSVQKCIRTPDIDEVGKTARHGTFFQMMGNFSFGDYFKEKAIPYAWELLTTSQDEGGYGLDPERLWVTIYRDDEESFRIWTEVVGFPAERIQRMGKEENFWDTGQAGGPAGPDSEIFYDRGPEYGEAGGPAVNDDRYMEIWNLVFMEFERGAGIGKNDYEIVGELPKKNIDTGMGLERLAMLLQGVDNIYETDQLFAVIEEAARLSGKKYTHSENPEDPEFADDVRLRVVADHVRASLMLIADGVSPSNEGRGYVLRRLLRRAIRAMRLLGVEGPSLPQLLPVSRDAMTGFYPAVAEDFERISRIAYAEENSFLRTIASGTERLDEAVSASKAAGKPLSGQDAFMLHDTYGFPIDLTLEMAEEAGVAVDEPGFRSLMEEQRQRAKADARQKKLGGSDVSVYKELGANGKTVFTGYDELTSDARVKGILSSGLLVPSAGVGQEIELVLDQTPFYAESGGQAADTGLITGDGFVLEVLDVQSPIRGLNVHKARVREGEVSAEAAVVAAVDQQRRHAGEQAHSATHLVHAALRQILGPEATQRGSFNKAGYLRFDFGWGEALSESAKSEIEEVSNVAIRDNFEVTTKVMALEEAKALGAMALFGENYGNEVRVVEINGAWSRELCGGTHVNSTAQVGTLSLFGEQSVGSGNRRVEAFVGLDAFRHLAAERALVNQLTGMLKVPSDQLADRISSTLEKLRSTEKELASLRKQQVLAQASSLAEKAQESSGVKILIASIGDLDGADALRQLVTDIRSRFGSTPAVITLVATVNGKPMVLAATNEGAREKGSKAGSLVKIATGVLGGGGGGKDDLAQGGGQDASKIDEALEAVRQEILKVVA